MPDKQMLLALLLCSVAALGCETAAAPELNPPDPMLDDFQVANPRHGNPFLGSWRMTSALVGDDELLVGTDLQVILTFWSDGHRVSVSNDAQFLICPEAQQQTSCEWNGTYSYTGATITFDEPNHPDPDEAGEDTGFYAHCGNQWFYLDDADDGGVRLTYSRTRQDCYLRDCG